MATLSASVGRGGQNNPSDVKYVKGLLEKHRAFSPQPRHAQKAKFENAVHEFIHEPLQQAYEALAPENVPNALTGLATTVREGVEQHMLDEHLVELIEAFQRENVPYFKNRSPDGRVDPGGATLEAMMPASLPQPLNKPPKIGEADYKKAADDLGCEVAAIKAVAEVESLPSNNGFLDSGRPVILFERHIFSERTGRVYDSKHPSISNSEPGGYGTSGEPQYERLYEAMACDRTAALKSASWGLFQVMGFNYANNDGFHSVEEFVKKMYESEAWHLQAFVNYIKENGLEDELKNKDWAGFAYGYNGPAYKKNDYDEKMKNAYDNYI